MELHLLIGDFKLSLVANKFERIDPVESLEVRTEPLGFQPKSVEEKSESDLTSKLRLW